MNKKAQITIFIIVGIAILIFSAGLFNVKKSIEKKKTEKSIEEVSSYLDTVPIKNYIEGCIENEKRGIDVTELMGKQGGYLDPDGDEREIYNLSLPTNYTIYSGFQVPVYLNGSILYPRPNITQMEEQISRYIILALDWCVEKFENAKKVDYLITKPEIDFSGIEFNYSKANVSYSSILVKSEASINEDEISIKVDYPLLIENKNIKSIVYDFRATLPVRLKIVHNISEMLVENMTRIYPEEYDLTKDCRYVDLIANNRTTVEIIEDNHNTSIILISDFGYYNRSVSNEAFRFYFIANNTNITGNVTADVCP